MGLKIFLYCQNQPLFGVSFEGSAGSAALSPDPVLLLVPDVAQDYLFPVCPICPGETLGQMGRTGNRIFYATSVTS